MTSFQIFMGLAIMLAFVVRRFFVKTLADTMPPRIAPFMMGAWIVIFSAVFAFFNPEKLFIQDVFFLQRPDLWLVSFAKGIMLWVIVKIEVRIKKESASSGAFLSPVGNGAIAVGNSFLGEILTLPQFLGVFATAVLGAVFLLYGHAKELSKQAKWYCLGGVATIMFLGATDYYVISASNWFLHIMMSGFGACAMALLQKTTREELVLCFNNKRSVIAGISIVFAEFLLLSSMVTVMPVSVAVLFAGLSVPIFMVMSSLLWGERSWKEQGLFGLAAFICMLPIVLLG